MHFEVIVHPTGKPNDTDRLHVEGKSKAAVKAALKLDTRMKGKTIAEIRPSFDRFYEARVFVNIGNVPHGETLDIEAVREHLEDRITLDMNSEDGGCVPGTDDMDPEGEGPPEVGALSIDWGTLRPLSINEIDSPYEAKPPRRDLLTDIKRIADRTGWNDDTLVQQLALFIANETTDSQALINFLEDQEAEEQSNLLE